MARKIRWALLIGCALNQTIHIVVAPNGQTRVEMMGFTGSACRQASEFIERALGTKTGETLKAEFHQTALSTQQVKEGT